MAEIKISQLDAEQQLDKEVDLKTESAKGNLDAFNAFTSLRGGAKACWCVHQLQ
jgi:hypothetical protein